MTSDAPQLVYFVSGMWCSTCAKNIRESVSQIESVDSADLNFTSKLLLVRAKATGSAGTLDQSIQNLDLSIQKTVSRIGFGIKKQSEGWILNFHESLQRESNRRIPWTQISLVWFLAMWSSMIAFSTYIGESVTPSDHYWLALAVSAFGLPAILLGIIPFGRAGLRALWFSRLLTLDLFIFLGGLSASAVSVLSLFSGSAVTYADSGSMIVAILLLTKKLETMLTTSLSSRILFQLHPKKTTVEVFRKNRWVSADVSQIKRGDRVRVQANETIPLDGALETDDNQINNHLMTGEATSLRLKKGDHIYAGAITQSEIELTVLAPQGERKIDQWAEAALLSENHKSRYSKLFSRIESALVIAAFGGAFLITAIQASRGASIRLMIESFFVGILIFCPCLFASIIPLMKQTAHWVLLKRGVILSRTEALLDLSRIKTFYFDKTGTLEAVESHFVPLAPFESTTDVTPYLGVLAGLSKHAILRGLNLGASGSPSDIATPTMKEVVEYAGEGIEAEATDGARIVVGRASFLRKKGIGISLGGSFHPSSTAVGLNGLIVGEIAVKSTYDLSAKKTLSQLLNLDGDILIKILSGDPNPEAGRRFTGLSPRITYHGNLTPKEKADRVEGRSAFVGDGLNDTLALAKADASFRIGHRVMGFAPVDFHLQQPRLELILDVIRYSKKYRKILIQTGCAALVYNILAITLAARGIFSPLGAVLSMLTSFSFMLLSVSRLYEVKK